MVIKVLDDFRTRQRDLYQIHQNANKFSLPLAPTSGWRAEERWISKEFGWRLTSSKRGMSIFGTSVRFTSFFLPAMTSLMKTLEEVWRVIGELEWSLTYWCPLVGRKQHLLILRKECVHVMLGAKDWLQRIRVHVQAWWNQRCMSIQFVLSY